VSDYEPWVPRLGWKCAIFAQARGIPLRWQ